MRFIKFASVLLLLCVFSGFTKPSGEAGAKKLSYFFAGKFENPYGPDSVKVFVAVSDQTTVVGFNTDNSAVVRHSAVGTYSAVGTTRYVSDFYGNDGSFDYYYDGIIVR